MIDAAALRKGNYISYQNQLYTVTQILWNRVEIVDINNHNQYIECTFDALEPIMVTPEMLLECGFVKHERFPHRDVFHLIDHNFIINILRDTAEISFGLDGTVALLRKGFIYLHQLQNLFYSLIGGELVYQPTHK